MENTIEQVEAHSVATVDPPEEILTAKEVALDSGASTSWVCAHADELGGYRVGRRLWFRWQRIQEDASKKAKQTRT